MSFADEKKLKDIEQKILLARNAYENLMPIYHAIDRKRRLLELDIKIFEKNKADLIQGQLDFDPDMGF